MKIPFPLFVCLSEQLVKVSGEKEREAEVNEEKLRWMAPPHPSGEEQRVNDAEGRETEERENSNTLPFPAERVMSSKDVCTNEREGGEEVR